ncbi:hypothetical protein V8F20_002330 [Naviculisporaceae sp. PSN 640]
MDSHRHETDQEHQASVRAPEGHQGTASPWNQYTTQRFAPAPEGFSAAPHVPSGTPSPESQSVTEGSAPTLQDALKAIRGPPPGDPGFLSPTQVFWANPNDQFLIPDYDVQARDELLMDQRAGDMARNVLNCLNQASMFVDPELSMQRLPVEQQRQLLQRGIDKFVERFIQISATMGYTSFPQPSTPQPGYQVMGNEDIPTATHQLTIASMYGPDNGGHYSASIRIRGQPGPHTEADYQGPPEDFGKVLYEGEMVHQPQMHIRALPQPTIQPHAGAENPLAGSQYPTSTLSPSEGSSSPSDQLEDILNRPPIHCSEVQNKEWVFRYHSMGNEWLVVRCPRLHKHGRIHTYGLHPLLSHRAWKHLQQDWSCHSHVQGLYNDEAIIRLFGYRVIGEELSNEWVKASNEESRKAHRVAPRIRKPH